MRCAACGFENPAALKFCGECGARQVRACPSCRAENPPGFKFCGECGAPLQAEPPPAGAGSAGPRPAHAPTIHSYTPAHLADRIRAARADLQGERKQVTVLFADLKGSTELIQGLDPEAADALLQPLVRAMVDAVHRYEGTVNRVQGDGVMALFGAPLAHEDHAVRASYAALALQHAVKEIAERVRREQGVLLQARVGLNSGEVVIREIGSDLHVEYDAVGPTTHLAARMEQLCPPGSVQLAPATLALAEGYVQVRSLGPVPVKGMPDPVEVFELLGAGQSRTRLQVNAARGLTRFVGRHAELETLRRALELAAEAHGQVVALVGEPGVGKSRTFWEFTHSHRTQDWLVLESGSVSYGKATSYLPVLDLLKSYCGVEPRDDAQRVREKLAGKVLMLDRALEPDLTPLLALLDVPVDESAWLQLDPPQRRRRTLDALRRLLLRESQRQPLVVVFEDLHWVDDETQSLLDALVESLPTARMLLLVNYRPEYRHGWSNKSYYAQLRIDPLPPASAGELLDALLGVDLSLAPLCTLLLERTGGNPFFLEESVRQLLETGALTGERGAHRLARPVAEVRVPATVQAILASRIDRLDPADKRLLQAAAVVGKDVPFRFLKAVADGSEDAVLASLARLQAAEFLYEAQIFPELEHTFKHALTHEVAYGSVLQERRRALHNQLVGAIEAAAGHRLGEHAELLAHHASRGELWQKAVEYGRLAGQRALGRFASREAAAYLEQALTALARLPDDRSAREQAVDLRLELRTALRPLGELERSTAGLREALATAEALDDRLRIARVCLPLCTQVEDDEEAVGLAERAAALFRGLGDLAGEATAQTYLGILYSIRDRVDQPEEVLEAAVAVLDGELGRQRHGQFLLPGAMARGSLAHLRARAGRFDEAFALAEAARRLGEEAGHAPSALFYGATPGRLLVLRGRAEAAVPLLEGVLASFADLDLPGYRAFPTVNLGWAYARAGRAAEGVALLEQLGTGRTWTGAGTGVWGADVPLILAEAYLRAGRLGEARTLLGEVLEGARARGRRRAEAEALWLLGEIAACDDPPDPAAAEQAYRAGLDGAESLGARPLAAQCRLGLGRLHAAAGARADATRELGVAAAEFRAMGMTSFIAEAEAALAGLEVVPA